MAQVMAGNYRHADNPKHPFAFIKFRVFLTKDRRGCSHLRFAGSVDDHEVQYILGNMSARRQSSDSWKVAKLYLPQQLRNSADQE